MRPGKHYKRAARIDCPSCGTRQTFFLSEEINGEIPLYFECIDRSCQYCFNLAADLSRPSENMLMEYEEEGRAVIPLQRVLEKDLDLPDDYKLILFLK